RLCGPGLYNNPNDLARILIVGVLICIYFMGDRTRSMGRVLWAIPAGILFLALPLTYSRGGFLGLLAGVMMLMFARLGRSKSIAIAVLLVPMLFVVFAGRMTRIDTSVGTGQQRVQIWRDAFSELSSSPILGLGMGNLGETIGIQAHNSF